MCLVMLGAQHTTSKPVKLGFYHCIVLSTSTHTGGAYTFIIGLV